MHVRAEQRGAHAPWPRIRWTAPAVAVLVSCAASQKQALPPEFALDLADVLVSHRSYETAVPLLRRQIAQNPNDQRVRRLLGVVLRDKGQYDEALTELSWAEQAAPTDPRNQAALGILYDLKGQSAIAEGYHRLAIQLADGRAEYHNNLGFCLYLQGRVSEAIAAYGAALRRDPTRRQTYNNLGFAHARLGDYGAAFRSFQQGGTEAAAVANLGLALELSGQYTKALRHYERSLKLDPQLEAAQSNIRSLLDSGRVGATPSDAAGRRDD